jgi:hypothetical protein
LNYLIFRTHFTHFYFVFFLFTHCSNLRLLQRHVRLPIAPFIRFIFHCTIFSIDDLIMKQHRAAVWQDLSTTQLLNWPHVEVRFRTQDICFVRRQETEFFRYLNFLPPESSQISESRIEHVENLPSYGRQKNCYSYIFLKEYMKVYMKALQSTGKVRCLVVFVDFSIVICSR